MRHSRLRRTAGYALTRTEAYAIVILVFLAVVVAIIGHWPAWVVPASVVAGVLLLGLLVIDSLADPAADVEAAMSEIDVSRVNDRALKAKVVRAVDYVRSVRKLTGRDRSGLLDAADDELPEMEQAARSIFEVSLRLQEFRADRLIHGDLAELRAKAKNGQLSSAQEAQLSSLDNLDQLVRSAEDEMDTTLACLGRAYAEVQAIRMTPEVRGRAADARGQLAASTRRLAALAKSYDELFGERTQPHAL